MLRRFSSLFRSFLPFIQGSFLGYLGGFCHLFRWFLNLFLPFLLFSIYFRGFGCLCRRFSYFFWEFFNCFKQFPLAVYFTHFDGFLISLAAFSFYLGRFHLYRHFTPLFKRISYLCCCIYHLFKLFIALTSAIFFLFLRGLLYLL